MKLKKIVIIFTFLLLTSCGQKNGNTLSSHKPVISNYTTLSPTYTSGTTISNNMPTISGGQATTYSITPALSSGLSLNDKTGVISGMPIASQTLTQYTVSASNALGSSSIILSITVSPNHCELITSAVNCTADPACRYDPALIPTCQISTLRFNDKQVSRKYW